MSTTSHAARKIGMTGAESFWYVLQCLAFGAGYFAKIPAKKALADYGWTPGMTGAESFWYAVMCLAFGAGYFHKVTVSKALSETPALVQLREAATHQLPPDAAGPEAIEGS